MEALLMQGEHVKLPSLQKQPKVFYASDPGRGLLTLFDHFVQQEGTAQTLPEFPNCGRGIKDDFCSIQAVHEPVERMMTPVTDIYSDLPKLSLEHRVASVPFHVVSRL